MLVYFARRVAGFVPLLLLVSAVSFLIIELPPGDYLTSYVIALEAQGNRVSEAQVANLSAYYGLDKPVYVRYFTWLSNIVTRGNLGWSFAHDRPVSVVIGERLGLTVLVAIATLIFTYVVAVPIGVFSAVRQYSFFDYFWTFWGFAGLAIPNFLLALVLLWISFRYFGVAITGLFGPEFVDAPWSLARVWNMLQRLWAPVLVVGTAGMAALIRVMRATLLDELRKQYVVTARAKGVSERRLLFKYPVRMAINPIISGIGWLLPSIISGATITSIVLNLPTTGPVLLGALVAQDMYLAGSFIMVLSVLVLVGNLISDVVLAWVDPRIRFDQLES